MKCCAKGAEIMMKTDAFQLDPAAVQDESPLGIKQNRPDSDFTDFGLFMAVVIGASLIRRYTG